MKRRLLPLTLFLALSTWCHGASVIVKTFTFDDFVTPYSKTLEQGEIALQPGTLEATANNPVVEAIDTLTSGDTAGAIRKTIVEIDPDPDLQVGDITVFNAQASNGLPPRLSFNADFFTAGTLVTEYDFSPIGVAVDAGFESTHFIIDMVWTDNRGVDLELTFTDLTGLVVTRDAVSDLGADLTIPGEKAFPFTEFGGIRFDQLTNLKMVWKAGEAYDGEIALIGTGIVLDAVPEPSTSLLLLLGGALLATRRQREAA